MVLVKKVWKKNVVVAAVVTSVIILGCGGLSYWIYESYNKAREEEETCRNQSAAFRVKQERVPSLEREVIMLRENVKEYVKILPDEAKVNDFADSLSGFAEESEVFFTKLDDKANRKPGKKKEVFDRTTFHLNLSGNLFQLLKFISLVENYERFVRISEITIKAGDNDENTLKSEVCHECSLKVDTFVYNSHVGGSLTKIQNYDKKREQLIPEIRSARNDIQIERYEYVYNHSIRDSFIDPRPWAVLSDVGEGVLDIEAQNRFITDVDDKILEIQGLLEMVKKSSGVALIRRMELQHEVGERIRELSDQIKTAVEEQWITDPACKQKMDHEICPQVAALAKETDQWAESYSSISLKDLTSIREAMADMYAKQDFEGCVKRFNIFQNKLEPSVEETLALDEKKGPLLREIREINRSAVIANDFYTNVDIKISGIVYQREGSVVIVNGQVLKEGDSLQDQLFVDSISENEVNFKFKEQIFNMKYLKERNLN